ncbi:RusA family crossover junction endodeoxyribonuclease [Amorphus orientalis]|uniref:Holliday junction resolvase RusA-like endonuclease n=1 Tax=Amorphus orientalis TaxID=649198 RepID=A0AAE3VRJ6_9HYPH|nr:RusA family crossover junction endodeoxyribonuclease [Amorphus orientalis]MDQ0316386.1 Holliday junction resolvase RusA-like endonuclease [Amorphus orientalis]
MTITLLGEPKSTSHIYHYHCKFGRPAGYMTAAGKALKEDYQWQARSQWSGPPLAGPLCVEVTLFFGTRRKADIDNFNKLWADALTGIAYEDDSQIERLTIVKGYDKARPRVEVALSPLVG